jgi:hypothetical protein
MKGLEKALHEHKDNVTDSKILNNIAKSDSLMKHIEEKNFYTGANMLDPDGLNPFVEQRHIDKLQSTQPFTAEHSLLKRLEAEMEAQKITQNQKWKLAKGAIQTKEAELAHSSTRKK